MTEMTREDIIRMAREAGGADIESNGYTSWVGTQTTEFLERFATIIASRVAAAAKAEEREACALLSEEYVCGNKASIEQDFIAESIADDIRARSGDKK